MYAIPNLNMLASPVRLTQRRMKLTPNEDEFTQSFVKEGWASLGFNYYDNFDAAVETADPFGGNGPFTDSPAFRYQLRDTYDGKGGYLQEFDVYNMSQAEATQRLDQLQNASFIDQQTRSIVVDFVLYNPYTQFFVDANFIAVFEANGLITTYTYLYDLKKDYYTGAQGYFRLTCEVCFCCLLVFYLIIEVLEIAKDVRTKKLEYQKEQQKRLAREQRRRELQQLRDDSEENAVTPEVGRNKRNARTPQDFAGLELREGQVQKKVAMHFCSFFLKGLQEHYNDGWNWIDSAFLLLSVVAVGLWVTIIADQVPNVQK